MYHIAFESCPSRPRSDAELVKRAIQLPVVLPLVGDDTNQCWFASNFIYK
jgi:hypothetical protein